MSDFRYDALYTPDFFHQADGIAEWNMGKLKYGDALCAIAYAFGLPSLEAVRAAVPFTGPGRSIPADGLRATDQLAAIEKLATRRPRGVLEIGAGRGEVSVAFGRSGIPVQTIEPSPGAAGWLEASSQKLFECTVAVLPVRLLNGSVHTMIDRVDWPAVDTVVMVESLEHILAEDFAVAYERIRDALRQVGGRFIVVNWLDYHPIRVGDYASPDVHCRLVDDALYDAWSTDARKVVYREGSHLVLDY